MRYSYQSDFQAYKRAVRTYVRSSRTRRFWFHFQMWGMLTTGIVFAVLTSIAGGLSFYGRILGPIAVGLIAGGSVAVLIRPWQLRRCYKAWCGEIRDRSIFLEIDATELRSGIEGLSEGRYQRGAICAVAEDDSTLLLFLNKKKFLYFPKSVVPQAAIDDLRAWVQRAGVRTEC